MKAMMIGLGPEYNYPKDLDKWTKANTRYASNHGASLISRAISKQFDAEFIDDFSDMNMLNSKYDVCFLAFATHVTTWRDVSEYADVAEKLDMPVIALSLGVQDYHKESNNKPFTFHPSLLRLLKAVSAKSKYIGVRGCHTASLLYRNGFKSVLPIGCPTMFWNLNDELSIHKPDSYNKPGIVYHRTLAKEGIKLLQENVPLIGQDFLDEAVFTKNLSHDQKLVETEHKAYNDYGNFQQVGSIIQEDGLFHYTFQDWFDYLSTRDFILGPRLHGCIASLVQGIPAVMLARDLRVREIADFFNIPVYEYRQLQGLSVGEIFEASDFTQFNSTYKFRYNNYLQFLGMNGLEHNLAPSSINQEFKFGQQDIVESLFIINRDLHNIQSSLVQVDSNTRFIKKIKPILKKLNRFRKKLSLN